MTVVFSGTGEQLRGRMGKNICRRITLTGDGPEPYFWLFLLLIRKGTGEAGIAESEGLIYFMTEMGFIRDRNRIIETSLVIVKRRKI